MPRLYTNGAYSTLASSITNVATTLTVATGEGARFPSPTGGDTFDVTLEKADLTYEIVSCTARSGDALTIVRAQQGTTALAFSGGDRVELRLTATALTNFFDVSAPDYLTVQTTDMVPTANRLGVQARDIAGRAMLQQMGPSGLDTCYQPWLGRNSVALWQPAGNATTITAIGAAALTATGTATAANVASTNRHTYMRRLEYLVTVAATTAVAGFREAAALRSIGGASAGDGGFTFICRWGPATGVATTTNRAFVGMANSTAAPTDVEPSTIANMIGMGWDAADTNIQLMRRDGTTLAKIDLGASFPVPTADRAKVYELVMFAPPGTTQSVGYRVTDLGTGAVASGTITTGLPTTATLLAARGWMSVGGTSSVIGIALMGLYLETDY